MRAIRVHQHGGPEVLAWDELPDPVAGSGQVVVRHAAVGVNFIDVYFRTGLYKPAGLPFVLGQEGAGTVEAVGDGVTSVAPGDRVAYTGIQGSYAERAAVPADRLVPLPDALSFRDGAAALLQGMTAHYLACSTWPLQPGDTCLVHAAPAAWACSSARSPSCAAPGSSAPSRPRRRSSSPARPGPTR
jgi:NADPH2:quinone reductase